MEVEFRCPKCAKRYKTSDEHSDKKTTCGGCGERIKVPFPATVPEAFMRLEISDEKSIYFLAIVSLFQNEMDFKLKQGTEKLLDRFDKAGFNEVVIADRSDVTKKRFWMF